MGCVYTYEHIYKHAEHIYKHVHSAEFRRFSQMRILSDHQCIRLYTFIKVSNHQCVKSSMCQIFGSCIRGNIHSHIHAYTHTNVNTYKHVYIHTISIHTLTYKRTYVYTNAHYADTCVHADIHANSDITHDNLLAFLECSLQ